jgi:hypothetical protein
MALIRKVEKYVSDEGFEFTSDPVEDTIFIVKTPTGWEARYLSRDEHPISPAEEFDPFLFLVNYHRDFEVRKDEIITRDDLARWYRGEKIPQEKEYFIFPVSSLIHGGVWLKLGITDFVEDPGGWDTSHVGAVLVSKKEARTEEQAKRMAQALINYWNEYLSGEVYGVVVDKFNEKKELVDTDSTWGLISFETAKEELNIPRDIPRYVEITEVCEQLAKEGFYGNRKECFDEIGGRKLRDACEKLIERGKFADQKSCMAEIRKYLTPL